MPPLHLSLIFHYCLFSGVSLQKIIIATSVISVILLVIVYILFIPEKSYPVVYRYSVSEKSVTRFSTWFIFRRNFVMSYRYIKFQVFSLNFIIFRYFCSSFIRNKHKVFGSFPQKKFHRNWFMLLFFQSIVVLILYYSYYWLVFQIHLRSKVPWVPTVFFPARRSYWREKSKAPRQLFIRKVLDINRAIYLSSGFLSNFLKNIICIQVFWFRIWSLVGQMCFFHRTFLHRNGGRQNIAYTQRCDSDHCSPWQGTLWLGLRLWIN